MENTYYAVYFSEWDSDEPDAEVFETIHVYRSYDEAEDAAIEMRENSRHRYRSEHISEIEFDDLKHILTVEQFEELFNVYINEDMTVEEGYIED